MNSEGFPPRNFYNNSVHICYYRLTGYIYLNFCAPSDFYFSSVLISEVFLCWTDISQNLWCLPPPSSTPLLSYRWRWSPPHLHHPAPALKTKPKEHRCTCGKPPLSNKCPLPCCLKRDTEKRCKDTQPPTHPTNQLSASQAILREVEH